MTIWLPDLSNLGDTKAPKYLAIADALARDIAAGHLQPGSRLPPHRDLAEHLGVTVGTVSRAYAEAQQRGLVTGEVGRGTFVRMPGKDTKEIAFGVTAETAPGVIDLQSNHPRPMIPAEFHSACAALATASSDMFCYQPSAGTERHRRAGAAWLARTGLSTAASSVLVTCGGQHAMLLALSVLTEPGDTVLAESLTYPGMNLVARFLRLRLVGVPMDEHGLRPDAFEEACRRHTPKALYCTPSLQNPTATVVPVERRRELADIARAFGVLVVEDDVYAHLLAEPPPPLVSFIPESGFYLVSLSKSVAPGLRIGYLHAPKRFLPSLSAAAMTTVISASPVMAEVASALIDSGAAERSAELQRRWVAACRALANEHIGPYIAPYCRPESFHVWLSLPEPWRAEEFVNHARLRGVLVASPEPFAVGRSVAPHAVRLSIGIVSDLAELERGLQILSEILAGSPVPHALMNL